MKLSKLTYHNVGDYYAHLYKQIEQAGHFHIHATTAEVLIHSVLGLPRNQIHSILVSKFPNRRFNPQYVKSIANKYREIIKELKETLS
ncbi:hypothetical protein [Vibrio crassostreae]|uniref:hypothetical protein n=1 Tax=Vibrio crassostreae TaxID=246167 RepID=UPI00352E139F